MCLIFLFQTLLLHQTTFVLSSPYSPPLLQALMRVDYMGRGELADRQQTLNQVSEVGRVDCCCKQSQIQNVKYK